jgi:peptidoglycan/LPS O-acetylase OafA/YrhL
VELHSMKYRPAVDILRVVAAGLIVCFHSPGSPYRTLSISGLAYFALVMFFLQGIGGTRGRAFAIRTRAYRLLVPWLVWCILYGLSNLVRHRPLFADPAHPLANLLVGTAVHFLLGLLEQIPQWWSLLLVAFLTVTLTALYAHLHGEPEPFPQWLYCAPLLPIGLSMGMAQRLSPAQRTWHCLILIVLMTAVACAWNIPSYAIGICALAIASPWKTGETPKLRWVASLSLGIYLAHPAVFLSVYRWLPASHWYVFASIGFFGSAAITAVILSVPQVSRLALGITPSPVRQEKQTSQIMSQKLA